jgi:hypothetical protein
VLLFRLDHHVRHTKRHPTIADRHVRETELLRTDVREFAYTRWPGTKWLEGRCRAGHNVITSPEVFVRGSVQRAVGGYRPELPHVGDLEKARLSRSYPSLRVYQDLECRKTMATACTIMAFAFRISVVIARPCASLRVRTIYLIANTRVMLRT